MNSIEFIDLNILLPMLKTIVKVKTLSRLKLMFLSIFPVPIS